MFLNRNPENTSKCCTRKYKEKKKKSYGISPERFHRIVRLSNNFRSSSWQSQVLSIQGNPTVTLDEHCRIYLWFICRSIKSYSTKDFHNYLDERLYTRKLPVFITALHIRYNFRLILCQLLSILSKKRKLWLNGETVLEADFPFRLLIWTQLWRPFW